jgi:hypothetical protein
MPRTVGETKAALAGLTDLDPASIAHYAVVMQCDDGIVLKFCCDDRREAWAMFAAGAKLILDERGEPLFPDDTVPPMPGDN